jgi:hypothetical protein
MSRKRRTQKKSSFNPWLAIVPAVLIIGGLIFFFSNRANAIEGVETFNFPPGQHRDGTIEYDRHPPAGGVHHPSWMNCGIYDTQVEVEKAVHSLEPRAWTQVHPVSSLHVCSFRSTDHRRGLGGEARGPRCQ